MSKIDLDPITSGYNLSKINSNFQKVEDELNNKVLYRNSPAGEPNSMSSNLDMNGQSILNANKVSSNVLELGGVQVVPTGLVIDPYNGTREALRRSYAKAGYNLVDGSFEAGGTVMAATDVLLYEVEGKAYSYAGTIPHTVDADSNPSEELGMWLDQSAIISDEIAVITPFLTTSPTHKDAFQNAINSGSVRIPPGVSLNIIGEISIPSNRTIIVDVDAVVTSNGRFTAYGVNNVHWVINGSVLSAGMTVAPAKSGWPNTAQGTQLGDERGFIEFGGVTFAGNDGDNYSVRVGPTGVIGGDWTGTPNFTDQVRQVNRKGIAAWNCSNVHFESDGEIYGFEGEAVYWFSRSAAGKNVYMRVNNLHDCRFNGVNVNALLDVYNVKIEKCVTRNTYQGIESSAGDVLDCRDYSSVKHSIYAGQGHGGDGRRISGNLSFDCLDVPFAIIYNKSYESLGRVKDVVFTDNHAANPATGFIAIADIENIQAHGNTCAGLKAGRFLQVTGCQGGSLTGNTNFNPAAGTEHYYEADCYSLFKENNKKVSLGGSYNALMKANDDFTGGLNSAITTHGNRENFVELRATVPNIGTGPEYRFSYDQTLPFVAATIGVNLATYDANGANGDICFNNLKINTSDTLATSWLIRSAGHFEPFLDAFSNIGSGSKRANTIYASTGTINTSDAREKTEPMPIDDAVLDAWGDVQLITFQWLESIRLKSEDGARIHFGVVAQQVRDALAARGLDGTRYGLLCYDEWEDVFEPVMGVRDNTETGEPEYYDTGEVVKVLAAGNRWGIRPDQCLFLEAAYQRRRCERIEARLEAAGL